MRDAGLNTDFPFGPHFLFRTLSAPCHIIADFMKKSRHSGPSRREKSGGSHRGHPNLVDTAREAAWTSLANLNGLESFAPQRLDQLLRESSLPDVERRLATELVYGIVRREPVLHLLLQKQIHRPWSQVEQELQTILLLGGYQLIYSDRIPAHAAVNTSVDLCARVGRGAARGFVNGVLRSLQRGLTGERVQAPSKRALPLERGEYLVLAEDLFSDPAVEGVEYFIEAFGFPRWLGMRWGERFSREQLFELGFRLNSPPRMTLRVNRLKVRRDEYLQLLEAEGMSAMSGETPEAIRLGESVSPLKLPRWGEGVVSVQDETAQRAAILLNPQSGERVWDVCAAPGGKTTHVAELMEDRGRILATEVSEERCGSIRENVDRLGLTSVEVRHIERVTDIEEEFDAVLIDVPCSNTGVLGKRPEARRRIGPEDLEELPRIQTGILNSAAKRVVAGGRLVYSTCSIEPEENRDVMLRFLEFHQEWRLVSECEWLPREVGDGGYQALLVRER